MSYDSCSISAASSWIFHLNPGVILLCPIKWYLSQRELSRGISFSGPGLQKRRLHIGAGIYISLHRGNDWEDYCFLSLPSIFQVSVTKLGRSNFYTQVERDTMKAKKYSGQDQEHIRISLNSDHAQTPIWHPDLSIVPRSLDRTQTTRSNPNL